MGMNVGTAEATEDGEENVVAEINVTPLTDVFLVLLIIFMVTANAMMEAESTARSGVKVALPKANAASTISKKRNIPVVTVTPKGEIYLFNKPVTFANLEGELKKAMDEAGNESLILRTDKDTTMGPTMQVMSLGKKMGFQQIQMLADTGK